jgi:DNA-binding Xre family transcriptional regulator
MRLIDADALKEYIDAQKGRPFIGCTIGEALKMMVDEQPTIEMRGVRSVTIDKEKVNAALKKHGMTQKELAKQIGMNHQALSYALSRVKRIDKYFLNRIGDELVVDPEELMGE